MKLMPDDSELDIPLQAEGLHNLQQEWVDGVQNRLVDRSLAIFVTFMPIVGAALAAYLHISGIFPVKWMYVWALIVMHFMAVAGVELGYHRLFSHNSFTPVRGLKIILAAMGSTAFQGPVIWWAAVHRKHHIHSDRPDDPHSMYIKPDGTQVYNKGIWQLAKGFMHAHVGWIWNPHSIRFAGWGWYVRDLYKDRDLWFIHVNYIYFLLLGFILPGLAVGLIEMTWSGFLMGMLWGGLVRIFVMNHLTYWSINTLSHSVGSRPYVTADRSSNSIPILFAIPTLGQSYHNNHHAFPYSAIMGHRWYEVDLGAYLLHAFARIGWVLDMRIPSLDKMRRKQRKNPPHQITSNNVSDNVSDEV